MKKALKVVYAVLVATAGVLILGDSIAPVVRAIDVPVERVALTLNVDFRPSVQFPPLDKFVPATLFQIKSGFPCVYRFGTSSFGEAGTTFRNLRLKEGEMVKMTFRGNRLYVIDDDGNLQQMHMSGIWGGDGFGPLE